MKALPFIPLFFASEIASAQDTPLLESEPVKEIVLSELLRQGGVMMFPLAALALIGLILIILYMLTIRRGTVVTNRFMNAADSMIRQRDFQGLHNYCRRRGEMVARLTHKTVHFLIENPNASMADLREVAETEGSRQSGILAQRITWLGDIGAIAPMVGLLGTVIGMIKSFMQISQGNVGVLQQMLAAGVSEALVTTATGLVVGITAIVFHSFFKGRVNRLLSEFEAASTHIMTLITGQLSQPPAPQQPASPAPINPVPAPAQYESDQQHPTHEVYHPQG